MTSRSTCTAASEVLATLGYLFPEKIAKLSGYGEGEVETVLHGLLDALRKSQSC